MLEIEYTDGDPETYLVPLGFVSGEPAVHLEHVSPHAIIANLEVTLSGRDPDRGIIYDTLSTGEAASALVALARGGATLTGHNGKLVGDAVAALRDLAVDELTPKVIELQQTNSTVPIGDKLIVKVLRQVEPGTNAELEVGRFLTQTAPNVHVPPVLGSISYYRDGEPPSAVAIAHKFVVGQGTAWDLFAGELGKLFETALASGEPAPPLVDRHLFELALEEPPPVIVSRVGQYLRHARLLGRRTGEVHVALASGKQPAFQPEKYTMMYQQSLFQGARAQMVRTFEVLAKRLTQLPPEVQDDARAALLAQPRVEERLRMVQARPLDALRTRVHGDLHLGQVLFTGDDFVVIDFEGEPARPLRERRYKRNPLRDVAGMLRSFDYAAESALRTGATRAVDQARARPWGDAWTLWVSAAYLAGYLDVASQLVPPDPTVRRMVLDFHIMEKCVYEIGYELNNRPDWLPIPVRGLLDLVV